MEKSPTKKTLIPSGNLWPFILITSLFFLWGLANNMTDTLLAAFKRIMSMTDFQTSWIQVAFYGSYFCLALPAAIFIKKFTYKSGTLLGLGLFVLGALLFYPASITMAYGHFLIALFILAGGLSILETAANPYIYAMGPEASGTRRLNLAQSFNPIGSIMGVFLSKMFILSHLNMATAEERALMTPAELNTIQSEELLAVMGPYVGVAIFLVVLWVIIYITKMPEASDARTKIDLKPTIKRLVKNSNYVMQELNVNEDFASTYYMAALILFAISRFIFTSLMRYIKPRTLLLVCSVAAALCTLVVIYGSGYLSIYALIAVSGFMSLMFPTIYGIAIRGLGSDTKIGGSGLIMAVVGGAVFPAIQGQISDMTQSISLAFYVPFICFLVIVFYCVFGGKRYSDASEINENEAYPPELQQV